MSGVWGADIISLKSTPTFTRFFATLRARVPSQGLTVVREKAESESFVLNSLKRAQENIRIAYCWGGTRETTRWHGHVM